MAMPEGWTGVVLAGGASSRMGRDKALIDHHGQPLLVLALQQLAQQTSDQIVIGDPASYGHLHPHVIPDDDPGFGPLGGLVTALRWAAHDRVLVLACDMPNVNSALLEVLKGRLGPFDDAVVPRHSGHQGKSAGTEPLVAAYHRRCYPLFLASLANGQAKMTQALDLVRVNYADLTPGENDWPPDLFKNLNAPSDL